MTSSQIIDHGGLRQPAGDRQWPEPIKSNSVPPRQPKTSSDFVPTPSQIISAVEGRVRKNITRRALSIYLCSNDAHLPDETIAKIFGNKPSSIKRHVKWVQNNVHLRRVLDEIRGSMK